MTHATRARRNATALLLLVAVVLATVTVGSSATAASVDSAAAGPTFVDRVNAARTKTGRPALTVDADAASVAQGWAKSMAASGQLGHNPKLQTQVTSPWTRLGENVGMTRKAGASTTQLVDRLHTAFMDSPEHRANVLGDFSHVGVGVAMASDGSMWVAVNLLKLNDIRRAHGANRVDTAVAVSAAHWTSAETVVLGSSVDFPDALAGGALAGRLGAPMLLTPRTALPASVAGEVKRLKATKAVVLGGEAAVSAKVDADLRKLGLDVRRIAGPNRFDTARRIAQEAGAGAGGEVVLTLGGHANPGRGWPDALAAGALAATTNPPPTLLTRQSVLPAETEQALDRLKAKKVLIIGGTAAVERPVENRLRALGYSVQRLAGANRYETSAQVAALARSRSAGTQVPAVFATGANFPDALSAGALAARLDAPVVLVPPTDLSGSKALHDLLRGAGGPSGGVVIGGPSAVSNKVVDQLQTLLAG